MTFTSGHRGYIFIVGCTYRGVGVLRFGRKSRPPKEGQSGKLLDEGPMGSQWLTLGLLYSYTMGIESPPRCGWEGKKKGENANKKSREDSTLERGVLEGVNKGGEKMCQLFTCFREVSHVFVM